MTQLSTKALFLSMQKEHGCISYDDKWTPVADPWDWQDAYNDDVAELLSILRGHGVAVPEPTAQVQVDA